MTEPHPKRRRLRFSLRTLFVVFTVVSVWFGWNVHHVRKRNELLKYFPTVGVTVVPASQHPVKPWKSMPVVWGWLGAEPIGAIYLPKEDFSESDREHIQGLLPEAHIYLP